MDTSWQPDLSQFPGPKYLALNRALRDAIRLGDLAEGVQLPTVRDLAWRLSVTPGTVARAYQLAVQEGMLQANVGRGTFVAERTPRLGPTQPLYLERDPLLPGRVDLRSPILPEIGQTPAFEDALRRVGSGQGGDWTDYPTQRRESALRECIVTWVADRLLGPVSPDDIALTHGGQNAILTILLCCLRGDRPVVLVEDLAYPGFRHAARLARAEVVPVELDEHGMVPDALEAACRRHGPQIICLTPEAQNPTAARMPADRRAAIATIARRFDCQIIEDDCYSLDRSDMPSIRALAPERTWYVGSWSKTVSAALRFGYIVCPVGLGEAGRLTAQHSFFAVSRPISDICLDLSQSGAAHELRDKVYAELSVRLQHTVRAFEAFDITWMPGLRYVYLRLPTGWRASNFRARADDEGVLLRTADEYALVHGRAPNAVRMALPGNVPLEIYNAAMARLVGLLRAPSYEPTV
jgi:DNA-binding transcriptional MocR family regulator